MCSWRPRVRLVKRGGPKCLLLFSIQVKVPRPAGVYVVAPAVARTSIASWLLQPLSRMAFLWEANSRLLIYCARSRKWPVGART
jgi:hypothetical protein